jgi:hypothetical protein
MGNRTDAGRWNDYLATNALGSQSQANVSPASLQASQKDGSPMKCICIEQAPCVCGAAVAGRKYDAGKAPVAQGFVAYFAKAMVAIAQISEYGSKKYQSAYADQNWRKVDGAEGRYADALMRHLTAHLRGEELDPESGKPHLDHAGWGVMALIELREQNKGTK